MGELVGQALDFPFSPVHLAVMALSDAATPADRQQYVFERIHKTLKMPMKFGNKDEARRFFLKLTQTMRDWNRAASGTPEFKTLEQQIEKMLVEVADYA